MLPFVESVGNWGSFLLPCLLSPKPHHESRIKWIHHTLVLCGVFIYHV